MSHAARFLELKVDRFKGVKFNYLNSCTSALCDPYTSNLMRFLKRPLVAKCLGREVIPVVFRKKFDMARKTQGSKLFEVGLICGNMEIVCETLNRKITSISNFKILVLPECHTTRVYSVIFLVYKGLPLKLFSHKLTFRSTC